MGTTFYNYHIRTDDIEAVRQGIEGIHGIAWIAAEPMNGWVSLYPYSLGTAELASALKVAILYLSVYDGDIAIYELYENGVLVDEYNSRPDYWGKEYDDDGNELPPKTPAELAYFAPSPEKLLPYCLPEFSLADVQAAFGKSVRETLEQAARFAQENNPNLTNIPDFRNFPLPELDRPDAFSVAMELLRLLGLENRFLYSGYGQLVSEEGFSLILVGEERLSVEDVTRFLEASIPDVRVIPGSGRARDQDPEPKLADMKKWLALGANPNREGYSPLMMAVNLRCTDAVKLLLEAGANANQLDSLSNNGKTTVFSPLMLAKLPPASEEIIALLQFYGAIEAN